MTCKLLSSKYTDDFIEPRNESFVFAASAMTPKLFAWIHDHKTLGRDKELGEGEVDVSRSTLLDLQTHLNVIRSGATYSRGVRLLPMYS